MLQCFSLVTWIVAYFCYAFLPSFCKYDSLSNTIVCLILLIRERLKYFGVANIQQIPAPTVGIAQIRTGARIFSPIGQKISNFLCLKQNIADSLMLIGWSRK